MIRSEARAVGLGALALLALGLFVVLRLQVNTDITHFLPSGEAGSESESEVQIAKELAAGELSRTMVLLIDAESTEAAVLAGRKFEAALHSEPRVAKELAYLDGGPPEGVEEALWTLYHPRRFAFFARDAAAVAESAKPAAARAAAVHLKDQLALPLSSLISRVAPEDPTLILPSLLERLEGGQGNGVRVLDGRFITEDGAAVLLLSTRAASMDSTAQRPLLAGVKAAFDEVARVFDSPITLSISGANRFAVRAEEAIQSDIQRVSIGSGVGLALLLLVLFRSLRLVLLVVPVISAGFLVGTSSCLLLFGSVHGLTLAFGAAMIGVSIDYAVHFHCHQTLAPHSQGPRRTLQGIWPGLALGAATTITGFVALLVSSFPGLRELAVFASTGIFAALIATRVFLPGLALSGTPPHATRWLVERIGGLLAVRGAGRMLLALPALAVLALALLGAPRLSWNDSIGDLNRLDPELLAEDEAVRARVVRYEQGRLVVAIGEDEEAALRVNDQVAEVLDAAQTEGLLGGSRSLATLLPSAQRQRTVDASVRENTELWPNLRDALAAEGFVTEGFEPFHRALSAPAPMPLTLADLQASPLAALVRPFRVTLGESVGIVSFLHELHDEAGLAQRVGSIEGARLIDIESALTNAYGTYRHRMAWLSLIGLGAVLALVAVRHRAVRPTLIACVPALLSAVGTIGAVSLLGFELNVLSLVALLMVVSMGVDYGVFLAEAEPGSGALEATHMAVFVAGTSTLLGFGLLAFSDQPALFSIGLTAGIGVSLCFVLAPTLNALLGATGERS